MSDTDTAPADAPIDTAPADAPIDTAPADAPIDAAAAAAPASADAAAPIADTAMVGGLAFNEGFYRRSRSLELAIASVPNGGYYTADEILDRARAFQSYMDEAAG